MFRFSNRNRSKRRKISFSPSKLESPLSDCNPKLFENLRVYVHPHTVNSSRRRVVHELIQKNGGSFTLVPDGQTTHILVDEGTLSRKPFSSRELRSFPSNVNVLMIGWLSASVRANHCLDPAAYKIPYTYKSTSITHQDSGPQTTASAFVKDSFSSVQLSTDSENNDINMIRFEYINEEVSTFDDGIYDQDTSCDDEWLSIPPVPSKTQNSSNPADTYTFRSDFVFAGPKITKFIYKKRESDEETSQSSSDLFDTSNSIVLKTEMDEYFSPRNEGTSVNINEEVYHQNASHSIITSVNGSEKQTIFSELPITSLESSSSPSTSQCQDVPAENIYNEQSPSELAVMNEKVESVMDALLRAIENVSRVPSNATSENTIIILGTKTTDDNLANTNNNGNVFDNEIEIASTESVIENALELSQGGNILENAIQIVNVVTISEDLTSVSQDQTLLENEIKDSDVE